MAKTTIIFDRRGGAKGLVASEHRSAIITSTGAEVRRATQVEPDNWLLRFVFRRIRNRVSDESRVAAWTRKWPCRWRVDLGLSGGPVIGPFQTRQAAIEAETKWLTENWLHQEREQMLVLSRKVGEKIRISDNITIVVTHVQGDKVRLGIEAPRDVEVHRGEVYDAIKREEATAGGTA